MYRKWTHNLWALVAILFYGVLVVRLFFIQVIHGERYQEAALNQSRRTIKLLPERGAIYDRNFKPLAFDVKQYSFGVNPGRLKDKRKVAEIFARITGNRVSYYENLLENSKRFTWLARGVSQSTAKLLRFGSKNPVQRIQESGRVYPFQKAAAHVLGFTNVDHVGLAGAEKTFNHLLEGRPGFRMMYIDGRRRLVPGLGMPEKMPENGKSVILTLNIDYQLIAEEELRRGIERYGAKGGMVVILDPRNGEVLAMASFPTFNPNNFSSYSSEERKNRVLVEPYEPGSTFKLVTAAAALEEHVLSPDDKIFCENGSKYFPGGAITDHKPLGTLTFRECFAHSSNIGFAKIARRLGKDRIYNYGRAFGFGSATGIELMGESKGKFTNPVKWSASDEVRIAIGYSVLVTPLQLANAYAAVANGGYLLRPRILKGVLSDQTGQLLEETKPDTIRRVFSPETDALLKEFMRSVVEEGTGQTAAIPGVPIAGKTGTTKKYDPALKAYSNQKYVASFVGFTPIDDPKLVCLVVVDEPATSYKYGSQSAAPIFHNILQRILGISKEPILQPGIIAANTDNVQVRVPDVIDLTLYQAKMILSDHRFRVRTEGSGAYVRRQQPEAGALMNEGEVVKLYLSDGPRQTEKVARVPDVRGKSLREAIQILIQAGYDPIPVGSGYVVSQSPEPGKDTNQKTCRIVCESMTG